MAWVVDLPPPVPLVVTAHPVVRRWCPVCRQWWVPPLPGGRSLGQGRLGLGSARLVATWRITPRLPSEPIQGYLAALHGLHLSTGGLVDLVRRVAQVPASPLVHGAETGWRDPGQPGYSWLLPTPGPVPVWYVEYDRSRAHSGLDRLVGDRCSGGLVRD